jgi:group I intron endonuclease
MICVYQIVNKLNDHKYIGSTNNFNKRKSEHFRKLKKKEHHSIYLQNAFNKYGSENFKMTAIIECTLTEKLVLEQHYLTIFKPEYNMSISATAPMQGRKHSEETLNKLKGKPGLVKEKCWMYGKKWTPEFREKVIKIRTGQKRTEEFKETQSKNAIKNNQWEFLKEHIENNKVKIIDSNGLIHNSMVECSKFHGIAVSTVCDILKGRHSKTRKGVSFKYYENT